MPILLIVVLLTASQAHAKADVLVDRAQRRLAHGNPEGAKRLVLEALAEDPSHPTALALACGLDPEGPASDRFRYLLEARTLDASTTERLLDELQSRVVDLPEAVYLDLERTGLAAGDGLGEALGPARTGTEAPRSPLATAPCGPLRGEAFGTPAHTHRDALRAVAARFEREGIRSAIAWARLTSLHAQASDVEAAEVAISRAHPATSGERIVVAWCGMRAAADRGAWWRERGAPILSPIAGSWLSYADCAYVDATCDLARDAYAVAGDADGIIEVTRAEVSILPIGWRFGYLRAGADHLLRLRLPKVLLRDLEGDDDSYIGCLRAAILVRTLQHDRAIEALERVVQLDPESDLAWEGLWDLAQGGGILADQVLAGEQVLALSDKHGRAISDWFWREWLSAIWSQLDPEQAMTESRRVLGEMREGWCILNVIEKWEWRGGDLRGVDDLVKALARTPELKRDGMPGRLASLLLRSGRARDLLEALDRVDPIAAGRSGAEIHGVFDGGNLFHGVGQFLREAAARTHFSPAQDAFLRGLLADGAPASGVSFRVQVCVGRLAADPEFLRLPAAAYVLSLARDPLVEREHADELRRAAFHAGCRARGLLADMARTGDDVLGELAKADPAEEHLVRAFRIGTVEALQAFLDDEDAATADQVGEAQAVLARRLASGPPPSPEPLPLTSLKGLILEGDTPVAGYAARLALAVLRDPRRDELLRLSDGRLCWAAGVGEALREAELRASPSRRWACRSAWIAQLLPLVELRLPTSMLCDEVTALLSRSHLDPPGLERVAEISRLQFTADPLDLRWVVFRYDRVYPGGDKPVFEAVLPYRWRDAAFLLHGLSFGVAGQEAERILKRILELRGRDAVAKVARDLKGVLISRRSTEMCRPTIDALEGRCDTDQGAAELCRIASEVGYREAASRLAARLEDSADPDARLAAIDAALLGDPGVDMLLQSARWNGWPEQSARHLLDCALYRALGREAWGQAVEAYAIAWERCPQDDRPEEVSDDCGPRGPFDHERFREALLGARNEASPPPWADYMALSVAHRGGGRHTELDGSLERVKEVGLFRRWMWLDLFSRASRGGQPALWEPLMDALPEGRGAVLMRHFIVEMARRAEDPVRVADAWADRCGDVLLIDAGQDEAVPGLGREDRLAAWGESPTVPNEALAAGVILQSRFGVNDPSLEEAHRRCLRAAERSTHDLIREACLISAVKALERHSRQGRERALPIAWGLCRGARGAGALAWAREWLCGLLGEKPVLADTCAALLLAEASRMAAPPQGDVLAAELALGSANGQERESASASLLARGEAVLPVLGALQSSSDPEVRTRVEVIAREVVLRLVR